MGIKYGLEYDSSVALKHRNTKCQLLCTIKTFAFTLHAYLWFEMHSDMQLYAYFHYLSQELIKANELLPDF